MDKYLKLLDLNGRAVLCEFERKRVKRINARLRSDGSLYCSLPLYASFAKAEEFVLNNSDFFIRALDKQAISMLKEGVPKFYRSGEDIKVFGVWKKLDIRTGPRHVEETDSSVVVYVSDISDTDSVKKVYSKWRRDDLKRIIDGFASELYPYFAGFGVKYPEVIRYGEFKSFWGECYHQRSMVKFSLRLHEQPLDLIRYVVAHEFAHFVVPNHSDRFWEVVTGVIPDAKACQVRLRNRE